MTLNVGDRLGHYDVTALIGQGGMGEVYRAKDTKLPRWPTSRCAGAQLAHLQNGGLT